MTFSCDSIWRIRCSWTLRKAETVPCYHRRERRVSRPGQVDYYVSQAAGSLRQCLREPVGCYWDTGAGLQHQMEQRDREDKHHYESPETVQKNGASNSIAAQELLHFLRCSWCWYGGIQFRALYGPPWSTFAIFWSHSNKWITSYLHQNLPPWTRESLF